MKNYTTKTREEFKSVKCSACDKNHDLEGFQVYLNKCLEDRNKFIYESKLCYGCLISIRKDQNAKNCKNRKSCKKCQEKHLKTLYGLKIEKKTTSRGKINNKNNISTNNTLVQEGDESGEMLSCNSTYTTSDVASMYVVKYGSSLVVETYAMLHSCNEGTFIEKGSLNELKIS